MNRKSFDLLLLEKNRVLFNRVILFAGITSVLVGIILYLGNIFLLLSGIDIVLGVMLIVLFFARDKIKVSFMIILTVVLSIFLGILTSLKTGFAGSAFYVFTLANIISIILLSKKQSRIIITVIWLYLIILMGLRGFGIIVYEGYDNHLNNNFEWGVHLMTYFLNTMVLYILINRIKRYLLENISELEESIENVYTLAYFDQLTKLPNKTKFMMDLEKSSKNELIDGYIALFEVKGLKLINSMNGEKYGDQLLSSLASIFIGMNEHVKKVGRVGGGEFVLWIKEVDDLAIADFMPDILRKIDEELKNKGFSQGLEIYVSYSEINQEENDLNLTYLKATTAMSYGKDRRKQISSYNDETHRILKEETDMKVLIANAIKNKEFVINYQEKIDLRTMEVVGVEALARWEIKEGEYISPAIFVPIIEKNDLALEFGNIIISKVLDDVPLLFEKYDDKLKISINISPSHLISNDFVTSFTTQIESRLISPQSIFIEITEEIMIEKYEVVESILTSLRDFGILISLDDFGTGYSSLSYLANMKIDELKIDRSFVKRMIESRRTQLLIKSIISLAKAFNLKVVAEGVEELSQAVMLQELGCHIVQGFYYSRPSPLVVIKEFKTP